MRFGLKQIGLWGFFSLWLFFSPLPALTAPRTLPRPPVAPPPLAVIPSEVFFSRDIAEKIGRTVTVSGVYYGGSIPMIIDDISRTDYNMELPPGSFLPLEGPRPEELKSGDLITVSGLLAKPEPASPLHAAPAVLKMASPDAIKISKPRSLPAAKLRPKKPEVFRRLEKFRPEDLVPGRRFAVLIAGGGGPENNHVRYWNNLLTMYSILLGRGFMAADIFVYYADGLEPDPEQEGKIAGTMPVSGMANRTNIQSCFRNLGRIAGEKDFIYILCSDHGGGFLDAREGPNSPGLRGGRITQIGEPDDAISESRFTMDLNSDGDTTDVLRADESLSMWTGRYYDDDFADDLGQVARYGSMVIHLEQCYSGGFLDDLRAPNRVIMSAAGEQRGSRAHSSSSSNPQSVQQYDEILYWFITALLGETPDGDYLLDRNGNPWTPNADDDGNGRVSVLEAFMFARRMNMKDSTPWYEDNGQPGCVKVNLNTRNIPEGKDGWFGSRVFF